MLNPYYLDEKKEKAIIIGYVIDIKDKGDANMLLFKQDTMDSSSEILAVAAWAPKEGQTNTDFKKMTDDVKGRFVVCVVKIRKKAVNGKLYTNYDLQLIIKPPREKAA